MIKLFSLKQQKKEEQASAATGDSSKKKTTPAQIRLQKDLAELELPKTMHLSFPDPDDILNFNVSIQPDEGYYVGGKFSFTFKFKTTYPHDPPKVQCTQKIFHPNIDLEGNVCLNILREEWKPVLNLQSIVVGLQFLFLEPNPDDPLNKRKYVVSFMLKWVDAATILRDNKSKFEQYVKTSMRGGTLEGEKYDSVLCK